MASITRYVNTGSTAGGNGTTNATTGDNRAYASLNEAEDALDGTAFGAGETCTINCSGTTADTTAVTFAGWDADVTVIVQGDNTSGKWDTGKYRLDVNGDTCLSIGIDNCTVKYIQCNLTPPNSDSRAGISAYLTNNVIINSCIVKYTTGGYNRSSHGIYSHPKDNGTNYIFNSIIYDFIQGTNTCEGIGINGDTSRSKTYVYSNTIYGCYQGINVFSRECNAKNNLCNGNTTDYVGTFNTTATNISEDTTSPNASFQSKAVSFVNEGSDDFHLASGDTAAKDAGTDTSGESSPLNFTTDIDGTTRSGTWDIGADEYVAAGGFTSGGSLKNVFIEW